MSDGMVFAGTNNGGVFRSTDNGASWVPINVNLGTLTVHALAVSDTILFAGT